MGKNKIRLILIAVLTLIILGSIALYGLMIIPEKELNAGDMLGIFIPLLLVVFMTFLILRRYRDIKQGMPLEDERSRKVIIQAAAKSFYVSLYWLLCISFFESFFANKLFGLEHLDAGQTVGGGIAGMAVAFSIFWIYYDRKGKLI